MVLDDIKKMRNEYYKNTGRYPYKIRVSRDVLRQIKEELKEKNILVYPDEDDEDSTIFGMKLEIVDEEDNTGGHMNKPRITETDIKIIDKWLTEVAKDPSMAFTSHTGDETKIIAMMIKQLLKEQKEKIEKARLWLNVDGVDLDAMCDKLNCRKE